MKRKFKVGMLLFSFMLFASCKSQNGAGTIDETTKLVIKFGSNITCKKNGINVVSGAEVKDGDVLLFTASTAQGKVIDAWYVGNAKQEGKNEKTFQYTVASKDAIGEKKEIIISFKETDEPKLLIKYDINKMSCKRGGVDLPNESVVNADEILVFTAKLTDKAVEKWQVNGVKQAVETMSTFSYTVREQDGQQSGKNKVITISYSERDKLFIQFDKIKMTCNKNASIPVEPNTEIFEKESFTFTAKPTAGMEVEKWHINGKAQENATNAEFTYVVKFSDAKEDQNKKVIEVTYTEKAAPKLLIRFDSNKMTCKEGLTGSGNNVNSNQSVEENSFVKFTATPAVDKKVKHWIVGTKEKTEEKMNTFVYQIKAIDGKKEGVDTVIEISYKEEDVELFMVEFDAKVTCKKGSETGEAVTSKSTKIKEGDVLHFTASPSQDKEVENWYVKNIKIETATETTFLYKVKSTDAEVEGDNKIIKVHFTEKEKGVGGITVEFNEDRITCIFNPWGDAKELKNGDTITLGKYIKFKAKVPEGETFGNWVLNGTPLPTQTAPIYMFFIEASHINNNKLLMEWVKK